MLSTHPTSARFGSGNSGIKNSKMNSNATFSLELLAGRFHIRIVRSCQRHEAREKKSKSDQDCVNADNC
jgi:hypothetical protein